MASRSSEMTEPFASCPLAVDSQLPRQPHGLRAVWRQHQDLALEEAQAADDQGNFMALAIV
jgi:hypothetical protein